MLWRLAVLLSLLLIEVQTAPFSSNFPVPSIPSGQRTQYYVLQNDGAYQQGYDTGSGQYHTSVSTSGNQVDGSYGYRNQEGNQVVYQYSAGAEGYIPNTSETQHSNGETVPYINSNPDTSYSFSYSSADQGRSESSDSEGNVEGQYYYVIDGQKYQLNYEAGHGKGFVVETKIGPSNQDAQPNLDEPPPQYPVNNLDYANPDSSYSFSYTADDHSRDETRDSRGFETSFTYIPSGASPYNENKPISSDPPNYPFPQLPESVPYVSNGNLISKTPISYSSSPQDFSFSYNANDYQHPQSTDFQGNIEGDSSFTADSGSTRQVDYEAGAGKGSIAKDEHLPQHPNLPSLSVRAPYYKSNPVVQPTSQPNSYPTTDESDYEYYDDTADRSYEFEFHAGDSARKESSDKDGRVNGYYTFLDDSRNQVTVHYQSGPTVGFQAYGNHIPGNDSIPTQRSPIPSLYPVDRSRQPHGPTGYMATTEDTEQDLPTRDRSVASRSILFDKEEPRPNIIQLDGGILQQWSTGGQYGYVYQIN